MGVVSGKNLQFPSVVKGQECYSVKKGAVDPLVPEHLGVLALTGFVTGLDSSISCNRDAMSQAEMRVLMQVASGLGSSGRRQAVRERTQLPECLSTIVCVLVDSLGRDTVGSSLRKKEAAEGHRKSLRLVALMG